MAHDIRSRLTLTGTMRAGSVIEARWIIGHVMETGFRLDDSGQRIPRNIITRVTVSVNGRRVLDMEPGTGLSSPPYLAFPLVVPAQGGHVTVDWQDDKGNAGSVRQALVPTP